MAGKLGVDDALDSASHLGRDKAPRIVLSVAVVSLFSCNGPGGGNPWQWETDTGDHSATRTGSAHKARSMCVV